VYQDITKKRRRKESTFLELAKRNVQDFTPGNRGAWKTLHLAAINEAKPVATKAVSLDRALKQGFFDKALFLDAAGGHFLTDAFASGHLFDKQALEIEIDKYLR
jgi:hypothetical protein